MTASPEGASPANGAGAAAEAAPGTEPVAAGAAAPTPRRRGQRPGRPGTKRRRREHLPEVIIPHTLSAAERTCPICGKVRPETGLTEPSEEIEWEVRLVRRRHVRHRYGPSCDCPSGRGLRTAPKPAKLIPKGLFAVSFWVQGLTVFVDHPQVPMDNNASERANRPLAVARKNFYGSGAEWSGELACACFTILATLRQHQICPQRYFQAYFEACARQGGRVPAELQEFLPWKWSAEKRAAWTTPEHPP